MRDPIKIKAQRQRQNAAVKARRATDPAYRDHKRRQERARVRKRPATDPPIDLAPGQELKRQTVHVNAAGDLIDRYDLSQVARVEPKFATVPPAHLVTKTTTRIDADGSVGMQYVTAKPETIAQWGAFKAAVAAIVADVPARLNVPYRCTHGPRLYAARELVDVYGYGDPHIGMLAWGPETGQNFDVGIAQALTRKVALELTSLSAGADVGMLVLIGDNYHADTDDQITPGHKHKLDVDTRAARVFRIGVTLWCDQIELMLRRHKRVIVDVVRGNHDPQTSFYLAEIIRREYRRNQRVEVYDNVAEYHYHSFGKVLIGTTHGHKASPLALAQVMATDAPDAWAASKDGERHWITGHIHSQTHWDFRGCSLETLRTLAPADAYASENAYRSRQDAVVITYHRELGEVNRARVTPKRAGFEVTK
jgi:hypothetical protein